MSHQANTLIVTILIELPIIIAFACYTKRSLKSLVSTGIVMNVLTQTFLWAVLTLFWFIYLPALGAAEVVIWALEAFMLHIVSFNKLSFAQAARLSLLVNGASLTIGWFLPY